MIGPFRTVHIENSVRSLRKVGRLQVLFFFLHKMLQLGFTNEVPLAEDAHLVELSHKLVGIAGSVVEYT